MAGAVNPNVGDYVGTDSKTGDWLFINAVDLDAWCVQIGPLGASGPWLDETSARAQYSYTCGAKKTMFGTAQNPAWPGYSYPATSYDDYSPPTERLPAPAVAPRCECGSGSSVRSGAHSHWCPCWVAP